MRLRNFRETAADRTLEDRISACIHVVTMPDRAAFHFGMHSHAARIRYTRQCVRAVQNSVVTCWWSVSVSLQTCSMYIVCVKRCAVPQCLPCISVPALLPCACLVCDCLPSSNLAPAYPCTYTLTLLYSRVDAIRIHADGARTCYHCTHTLTLLAVARTHWRCTHTVEEGDT